MKRVVKTLLSRFGYDLIRHQGQPSFPVDFDEEAIDIIKTVTRYTLTSNERIFALIKAAKYIERARIPGSIVECGVWRGGSIMAAALTLQRLGVRHHDLYLFDTFEGMTVPADVDVDYAGVPAEREFRRTRRDENSSDWCRSSFDEVFENILSTGYPRDRIKMIKGKVEETIPGQAPSVISLLRLDTDWYESTRHELVHLYPRLSSGGVLIIDDYGHWRGSQKATDEFFEDPSVTPILLSRIDYTGRIGVKQ